MNRLAQREANAKKPIYTMHKWWARRLSCVFRTVLLASAIDWADWDALEPWLRDADGDFVDKDGRKILNERDYHKRVRDTRPVFGRTNSLLDRPPTAWERLYYRLDDEANAVIEKAFKGKLVLDPFMGGGTTIVEALRLGADVAGCDLNPVAWYVVKKETDGIDPALLDSRLRPGQGGHRPGDPRLLPHPLHRVRRHGRRDVHLLGQVRPLPGAHLRRRRAALQFLHPGPQGRQTPGAGQQESAHPA